MGLISLITILGPVVQLISTPRSVPATEAGKRNVLSYIANTFPRIACDFFLPSTFNSQGGTFS